MFYSCLTYCQGFVAYSQAARAPGAWQPKLAGEEEVSMAEPVADHADTLARAPSRRHASGSLSARGMLLTVLGEVVLPGDGSGWTASFIQTLSRLGIEEKAVRQALMRTATDGWLSSERVGRRTRWHLTDSAVQLLTEGAQRIYAFTGAVENWDGRWLLVSARIAENDRAIRHIVRSRLAWAGFGSLGPALWISSHADREREVCQILLEAGCADTSSVFIATRPGVGDIRAMVSQAWDLAAIEAAYEAFLRDFGDKQAVDPLTSQIELVHAWRRFPAIDPALPRELLPELWSGVRAAELFASRHETCAVAAREQWRSMNATSG